MAFNEKSAWIMSLALVLGGVFYGLHVADLSQRVDGIAPPTIPSLAIYTMILIAVAVIGHAVTAAMAPRDASAQADERDRQIIDRAGHRSSYLLGVGVILSLLAYLVTFSGNLLFYGVFASLMLSQLAEYGLQIWFYRRPL